MAWPPVYTTVFVRIVYLAEDTSIQLVQLFVQSLHATVIDRLLQAVDRMAASG